jgi:hypothetical protein
MGPGADGETETISKDDGNRGGNRDGEEAPAVPVGGEVSTSRRRVDLAFVYTLIFGVAGWALGLLRLYDNSFLWHLRTGEYILDHGIPHRDIFSFSAPGVKWIAQSWLAELVYGALMRGPGAFSIRVLGGVLTAGVLVIVYRAAYRLAREPQRAAGLTLLVLLCFFTGWSNRPLLFGFFFFATLVYLIELPETWLGRHAVWVLPPLMWLWGNTHGTFSLGFVYLGLHLVGEWLEGTPPWVGRSRSLLIGAAIGLVVLFANPYGFDLVWFPVALLSRGGILKRVVEWRSPDFKSDIGIALALTLAVVFVIAARAKGRFSRRDLIVVVPFLGLALWAQRNIPLAAILVVPIAARVVRPAKQKPGVDLKLLPIFAVVVFLVGVMFTVVSAGENNFAFDAYPVKTLNWAEQHHLLGPQDRLLTDDAWAGYVIYKYWPQQKVFVDDRFDMYPIPLLNDSLALQDGTPKWSSILAHYRINTIVWPRDEALSSLLAESPNWRLVHRDAKAVVYVKR